MLTAREISFQKTTPNLSSDSSKFVLDSQADLRPPLPAFDANGYLPPGIYDSTLEELTRRFASSPFRQGLWDKGLAFLNLAAARHQFIHAYIAGGFVTCKPAPLDIDLVLETAAPYGPATFKIMEPFFAYGLDAIFRNYSVHLHFWGKDFPDTIGDCCDFFQSLRPHEATSLGLPIGTRRGIVRLRLPLQNHPLPKIRL